MKQPLHPCSCIVCKKSTSSLGIATHYMRTHGSDQDKQKFENSKIVNAQKTNTRKEKYIKNPNYCPECNKPMSYSKRHNKFCSSSCAGASSNRERKERGWTPSVEQRESTRAKLKKPSIIWGQYTRIYFTKCKFCSCNIVGPTRRFVCDDHQNLKYKNNRDQWSFKFNVYDYPNLFDLNLLDKIGWCSFGGKGRNKKVNTDGLSRDHKVSVSEAKINQYDPYYISHPCNCQLMTMKENNSKNSKSSITYNELVELVDMYDHRGEH